MTVPERIIPPANLPPGSQQWGRDQQGLAVANRNELNALSRDSDLAYKQLNSAVNGAAAQTTKVRNTVYSMPSAYVNQESASGFALPANTWTYFGNLITPQVRNKNRVTVFVTLNISLAAATVSGGAPTVYVVLSPGNNDLLYTSLTAVDYTNVGRPVYRNGQVTHSATFSTERGKFQPGVIYCGVYSQTNGIAANAENRLNYNTYIMYGGEEAE